MQCNKTHGGGVAIASSSQLAADAGRCVALAGGNAVDAAIAASLVSMTTEPGVCSLGGGGYVAVWPASGVPVTIDGYVEMPGRGKRATPGQGTKTVYLDYGGGLETIVGPGSVATPGALAACGLASERFGELPWEELVRPAIEHATTGFPLSDASYRYLRHASHSIYGWNAPSRDALHSAEGRLLPPGARIHVVELAESLQRIAANGVAEFYTGALGQHIAHELDAHGGLLTSADLEAYRPIVRPSLSFEFDGWRIATNPPPAIGGTTLAAMLMLMRDQPENGWNLRGTEHLVRVQEAVLRYRRDRLDLSDAVEADAAALLESAQAGRFPARFTSSATVHTSVVDDSGLACAITMSAGYGSGLLSAGIWLNNCLGELELNRRAFQLGQPGTRLPSNMAPTVARRADGETLAIGSPGADRITTAILQTLVNFIRLGMSLSDAIAHPRAHVIVSEQPAVVAYERGLPVDRLDLPQRCYDEISMFFGGVGACVRRPSADFLVAADERRVGGTAIAWRASGDG